MARSRSRRFARVALVASGVAAAATVANVISSRRRWASADDPTAGEPLRLAEGVDSVCVTDDGARLAVRTIGTGTAGDVLLPHCWMGSRRFWGPVAQRLVADGHRVVVYDQRGHGASTIGGAGLTIEALGDDVEAVLRHMDGTDVVVAGHSLGGMSTQAFLIRHPDVARRRVRGVVLVSTACEFRASAARLRQMQGVFGPRMTAVYGHAVLGPVSMRQTVGRRPALSHLQALAATIAETPPDVRVDFLLAMADMDLAEGLAAVDVPVTILVGSRDTVTTPEQAMCLEAAIPGAELDVVTDAGHMLVWEAPDRVVAAIEDLAAARTGSSGSTAAGTTVSP